MEIKKVAKGWEYDGILFKDERSAHLTKEATESALPTKAKSVPQSQDFKLKYDGTKGSSFGRFIEQVMTKQDKGIVHLARDLSVSRQTLFDWMNAESVPTIKHLMQLARVTGCSKGELKLAIADNLENQKQKVYSEIDKGLSVG